jgi:hypothetical protein
MLKSVFILCAVASAQPVLDTDAIEAAFLRQVASSSRFLENARKGGRGDPAALERASTSALRLSAEDFRKVEPIARQATAALEAWASKAHTQQARPGTTAADSAHLQDEWKTISRNAMAQIRSALGPAARTNLDQFLKTQFFAKK